MRYRLRGILIGNIRKTEIYKIQMSFTEKSQFICSVENGLSIVTLPLA